MFYSFIQPFVCIPQNLEHKGYESHQSTIKMSQLKMRHVFDRQHGTAHVCQCPNPVFCRKYINLKFAKIKIHTQDVKVVTALGRSGFSLDTSFGCTTGQRHKCASA